MSDRPAPTAEALRRRFRAIPKETRDANQAFSVRVWRALSWLERSEAAGEADLEGRFIPLWIAFNALFRDVPTNARAWRIPHRTAQMVRKDPEAAGIPFWDGSGRVADFHALRHTFITRLARSGVMPAVAMELARHSSITLTMSCYTHILVSDKRSALAQLPLIESAESRPGLRATGTDGLSGGP